MTDGEPETVVSASLQKIKLIKNPIKHKNKKIIIKSETSDSFVNHFDGHFAYLKTLDFYFKCCVAAVFQDQGTGQNGQNAADGTNTGNQNEQSPPQRPANAIVLQSQRRQQRLNAEADKLHQNVENLIKAYRRLISQT